MKYTLLFISIICFFSCSTQTIPVTPQQETPEIVKTEETVPVETPVVETLTVPLTKKELLEKVVAGNYAPTGTVYQPDSTSISTDQFKGKYVVLDFWATWCGPCVKEGPIFQAMGKRYEDKNVAFIGISVDRDFQKWQKFLTSRQWQGQQYWMGMEETAPFFGFAYSEVEMDAGQMGIIVGLPKYVMLDPDGKILHNSSYIKPSNPKFEELLTGFLTY